CGTACPAPASGNGVATCTAGVCGIRCDVGFHQCGAICVADNAVASCGTACTPCAVPDHAIATCDANACGFACVAGYHACSGTCVSNTSPMTCGVSCMPCAVP